MSTLLDEALKLKHTPRRGWLRAGVPQPESVAAHAWGVAWLALVLCPEELDQGRALALAIIHDLAEVKTGDITPHDGIDRAEKRRLERAAAASLFADHPRLWALWEDYARQGSPEARFVHDLDKLDMALQARRYAHVHQVNTSEFIASARAALGSSPLGDAISTDRTPPAADDD